MTYRVDSVIQASRASRILGEEHYLATRRRNRAIRDAYVCERMTLQQLADATGLTRQRIQQIVSERGER
jgi:DNA-directed RNA polymerase sigma subunit (sigma70/sigma32)